jgi:hypothetical protein
MNKKPGLWKIRGIVDFVFLVKRTAAVLQGLGQVQIYGFIYSALAMPS